MTLEEVTERVYSKYGNELEASASYKTLVNLEARATYRNMQYSKALNAWTNSLRAAPTAHLEQVIIKKGPPVYPWMTLTEEESKVLTRLGFDLATASGTPDHRFRGDVLIEFIKVVIGACRG